MLQKTDKMLCKALHLIFFPSRLINSIIHEHLCNLEPLYTLFAIMSASVQELKTLLYDKTLLFKLDDNLKPFVLAVQMFAVPLKLTSPPNYKGIVCGRFGWDCCCCGFLLLHTDSCTENAVDSLVRWESIGFRICRAFLKEVEIIRQTQQSMVYLSDDMRKPVFAISEQERCRSACAFAQSDQHLYCSLLRYL